MILKFCKNILRNILVYFKILRPLNSEIIGDKQDLHQLPVSWEKYREYVRVHSTAIIAPFAQLKIFNLPEKPEICLEIGEESHVFSSFSLLRPCAKIKIGKRCQLGGSSFIAAESIEVGDDVIMAWGCTIMDNDSHSIIWAERKNDNLDCYNDYKLDPENFIKNKNWSNVKIKPIKIGNKTWIGFNVTVLKGVTFGDLSVAGACSVITRDVPPNALVAGNPAKIQKMIEE